MAEVKWSVQNVWTKDVEEVNTVTKVEYLATLGKHTYGGVIELGALPLRLVNITNDDGDVELHPEAPKPFVKYDNLSPPTVLDWVFERVNKDVVETFLRSKEEEKQPQLPWAKSDAS